MYEKIVLIIAGSVFLILSISLVVTNFEKIINSETVTYETCLKNGPEIFSRKNHKCGLGDEKGILVKPAYTMIYWAIISVIASLLCFTKLFRLNRFLMFLSGLFTVGLGGLFSFTFNSGSLGITISAIILLCFGAFLTLLGIKRIFSTG